MYVPEFLIEAALDKPCSPVYIFCNKNDKQKIIRDFKSIFDESYKDIVLSCIDISLGSDADNVIKQKCLDEMFIDIYYPIKSIKKTDFGIVINTKSFAICDYYGCGENQLDFCDSSLELALKYIVSNYPGSSVSGFIGYFWCDSRYGEIVQYCISECNDSNRAEKELNYTLNSVYDYYSNLILKNKSYIKNIISALYSNYSLYSLSEKNINKLVSDFQIAKSHLSNEAWIKLANNLKNFFKNLPNDKIKINQHIIKQILELF